MSTAAFSQRLRSSGIWAASGRILSGLLLLALHGILARSLSSGDYGCYVLIESVSLVLSVVCMAGIPTVTLRLMRSSLSEGDTNRASMIVGSTAWVFAATSVVTALVTVVVSQVSTQSLPDGLSWRWMPWFLAWAILAAGLRIQSEIYRAYDRYSVAYCIGGQSGGLLLNACLVVFSVLAVYSERISLQGVLTIQIVVQLILIASATGELRRHLHSLWSPENRQMTALLFLSAWPLLAQQLVSVGLPEAGKLLLGFYSTTDDAGMYNAAVRLVLLAHVPLMVVNNAIQPFITELYASRNKEKLTTLIRGSATLAALPCLGVLFVFFVFPEFVLSTTFGPDFVGAARALRILSLGSLAWVLSGSCGLVLMMTGHERSCMLGTILPGVAYLICCPWLIEHFGLNGAASGATFLQLASNGLCMLLVFYHHRIWTAVTFSQTIVRDCLKLVQRGKRPEEGADES